MVCNYINIETLFYNWMMNEDTYRVWVREKECVRVCACERERMTNWTTIPCSANVVCRSSQILWIVGARWRGKTSNTCTDQQHWPPPAKSCCCLRVTGHLGTALQSLILCFFFKSFYVAFFSVFVLSVFFSFCVCACVCCSSPVRVCMCVCVPSKLVNSTCW